MSVIKIIVKNSRAGYDFFIEEKVEAGIELKGTEVKSLREGKATLNEAFVTIDNHGEAWIYNLTIPHYTFGNIHNHEETRKRKLLLHKDEILELNKKKGKKGLSLITLML